LAALSFFLFGPGDGAARLISLLAGFASVALAIRLGQRIDPLLGWASGILLALSPTFVVASTRLDGAMLLVSLALAAACLFLGPAPARPSAVVVGLLLGTAPLAHPLGWILTLGGTAIVLARWSRRGRNLVSLVVGALLTITLTSTFLFTRPDGLARFLVTSWQTLVTEFLGQPFAAWSRPLVLLATEEFPIFVLALSGAILSIRRRAARGLPVVAFLGVGSAILFGNGRASALALAVTSALFLAGYGLCQLLRAIPWSTLRRSWDSAVLGMSALALLLGLSLIGRLLSGPQGDAFAWLAGVVSLLLLLFVTLWSIQQLWRRAVAPRRTLLVLPLLALSFLASRDAMLANATTSYRPGTVLHGEDSAPGLRTTVDRLRRASMDLTMFQFDPRDPTGGHGLVIVLHDSVSQPFAWYLRDFPSLRIVSTSDLPRALADAQVIVIPPEMHAGIAAARPELVWQPVPAQLAVPAVLRSPPWGRLVTGIVDPRDWREYITFLLYRRIAVPNLPQTVLVGLVPEVATRAGYSAVP
ncbi:MAG: hypothetical protein J7453_07710, partial [Thermomicrobium sp.]|nr:hypothetical protein [Thermomicrobium sp.]